MKAWSPRTRPRGATPKKERGSRTALRSDEYTKLLSLAGANPRDYAILQVFLQTGIRVSELCALTREDIDFERRLLRIAGKGHEGPHHRAGEARDPGDQELPRRASGEPADALFLNYQGEPLSERGVRKMLAKYLKAAGITKKISPHSLRHTFATYKAERGVSPYVLGNGLDMPGWTRPRSTSTWPERTPRRRWRRRVYDYASQHKKATNDPASRAGSANVVLVRCSFSLAGLTGSA